MIRIIETMKPQMKQNPQYFLTGPMQKTPAFPSLIQINGASATGLPSKATQSKTLRINDCWTNGGISDTL